MEDTISSWMTHNKDTAEAYSFKVIEINPEFVKLQIAGHTIQLIVPPSFHDASLDEDSTFLALNSEDQGPQMDDTLERFLPRLNEKLQRIRIGKNCLNTVLDCILQGFRRYGCIKRPRMLEVSSGSEATSSYLYKSAEEARVECELALSTADEESIAGGRILPWCSVSVSHKGKTVILEMLIEGIMVSDNATKALGFCFDGPLRIILRFEPQLWVREQEISLEALGAVGISVSSEKVGFSVEKVPQELDEKKIGLERCCFENIHHYGPRVLVPDLVREYFSKGLDEGLLYAERSNNVFCRLLLFVGNRLSTLGSWCCNCKKELPPLSRSWYCDAELCLFRHEELGVGTSVLQELQNSELIELEVCLALAASASSHDVFEPYPSFLLKQREFRGRSGFFSTDMTNTKSSETNEHGVGRRLPAHERCLFEGDNKKMSVLMLVIQSFPPVAELQKCQNESELRLMLSTSLQNLVNSDISYEDVCLHEEFLKDFWLPYNVLRFVLLTNKLSLSLLKHEFQLEIQGADCQFAVLYDSEREKHYEHCRATKGSFFAYHGSSTKNWYSILRNGLRCLSGSQYMRNGMSCGKGIYFSKNIDIPIIYCRDRFKWKNQKCKSWNVIAICEIFLDIESIQINSHIVVPPQHQNDIVIRYLVVFSGSYLHSSTNLKLHEHYNRVRGNYLQKLEDEKLAMKKQHLISFQQRGVI